MSNNVNTKTSNASESTRCIPQWKAHERIRPTSITTWFARKKLELELIHYGRVASTLIKQIDNDTEALAYAQIRQAISSSKLRELGQ